MNKKANISIGVLVFMTFALCSLALLSFYINSREVKSEIKDVYFINKLYSFENEKSTEIYFALEEVLSKNYALAIKENSSEKSYGYIESKVRERLNEYDLNYLNIVSEKGKIRIECEFNEANIGFLDRENKWNWGGNAGENYSILAIYRPKIEVSVYFENEGLNSFEEIFNKVEECENTDEIQNCFNDIENFNVKYEEAFEKAIFVSKREFYSNNEIKPIKFDISLTQDL